MRDFINYAYYGQISITTLNVQKLLIAANFLQVPSIIDVCSRFIEERVSVYNALDIYTFAQTIGLETLSAVCDQFIKNNFEKIAQTKSFIELDHQILFNILSSDMLCAIDEKFIFECLMRWVINGFENASSISSFDTVDKHQLEDGLPIEDISQCSMNSNEKRNMRLVFLPDLLKTIRLSFLPVEYLSNIPKEFAFLRSNIEIRDIIDEAKNLHLLPHLALSKSFPFNLKPRYGQEIFGIIYAIGGLTQSGDVHGMVEAYNPSIGTWKYMDNLPVQRSRIDVAVLNGCLYVVGGYDGKNRLAVLEMFDPTLNRWTRKANMNVCRSAVSVCSMGDRIYACGGYDGNVSLRLCEMYNPTQDKWHLIPSMLEPRSAGGVVSLHNRKIYAIGGHNGRVIHSSVEYFDPKGGPCSSNQIGLWMYATPMLTKRCRHGVAILRNRIFAAGGYDGSVFLDSVEMCDPDVDTVVPCASAMVNLARQNSNLDGSDEVGEFPISNPQETESRQSLNLKGQWTRVANLQSPRSRVSLAVTMGRIYAVGGFDGIKNLNSVEIFQPPKSMFNLRTKIGQYARDTLKNAEVDAETDGPLFTNAVTHYSQPNRRNTFDSDELSLSADRCETAAYKTFNLEANSMNGKKRGVDDNAEEKEESGGEFSQWFWGPTASMLAHVGGVGLGVVPVGVGSPNTSLTFDPLNHNAQCSEENSVDHHTSVSSSQPS